MKPAASNDLQLTCCHLTTPHPTTQQNNQLLGYSIMRVAAPKAAAFVVGVAGLLVATTPAANAFCNIIPGLFANGLNSRGGSDDGGAAKTIFDFTVRDAVLVRVCTGVNAHARWDGIDRSSTDAKKALGLTCLPSEPVHHTTPQVKDWQGNPVPLAQYKDKAKVALVVNVASK